MSARDFSPQFSINFDGEAFPGEEERKQLGYEPDAAYLIDQEAGYGPEDTSMVVEGKSSDDFLRSLDQDYVLVFSYRNSASTKSFTSTNGLTGAPTHQFEGVEASIEHSQGFDQLIENIGEELDGSNTIYSKQFLLPGNRSEPLEDYENSMSSTNIHVFPSEKGIAEVDIDAVGKTAEISCYSHRLETPRVPDATDYRFDTLQNERGLTEIDYDYSESNVESLEEFMRSLGFYTDVEFLPSTVLPRDFK